MSCSGYPLEWFVEPIDDYLKCGICGKVLHSPQATSCGHVFCNHCLVAWIEYYGICPNRCGEVELQHLTKAVHIHKRISGLLTRCRYYRCGCSVQVPLAEKHKHEKVCSYRCSTAREPEQIRRAQSFDDPGRHRFKRSRNSTVTTRVSLSSNRSAPSRIGESPRRRMQAPTVVRTYKLKRTRPKEPLGLVLMSGAKTVDGTLQSFYVKQVNRDTPAWKSGLEPGDKIIQVDNFDLCKISTQEAVARIKDQTAVTLTILRGGSPPIEEMGGHYHCLERDEHIYDEILYTDLIQLSQPDENYPPLSMMSHMHAHRDEFSKESPTAARRNRVPMHFDLQNRRPALNRPMSPVATYGFRTNPHQKVGEKSSKDSGLSSGSSGSPHPLVRPPVSQKHPLGAPHLTNSFLDRNTTARHSYRTEREMLKNFIKTQKKIAHMPDQQPEPTPSKPRNCRIEGDYEVEEIYLEKNGTSQLGVTLGYDTKSFTTACLYVCEVIPTGLAAKDGRLRPGDIIRRVNGFEVFDAEEAVLLFLEQDQDITLTVARKIRIPPSRLELPSQAGYPALSQPTEPNFDLLESTLLGGNRNLRRIDSCGSLDSHSHKYATTTGYTAPSENCDSGHPDGELEEPLRMSHENLLEGDYGQHLATRGRRKESPLSSRSPPFRNRSPLACNEFLSQQTVTQSQQSPVYDHSFRPILAGEQRPKTAGDFKALNSCKVARPSSTTPDSRRKVYGATPLAKKYSSTSIGSGTDSVGSEPNTLSPPPSARKVPTNFRTGHPPSRHHALVAESMYNRSESLV